MAGRPKLVDDRLSDPQALSTVSRPRLGARMSACNCGKVRWDYGGGKLVLYGGEGAVVETVTRGPLGIAIKVEHIDCQTCVTIQVA